MKMKFSEYLSKLKDDPTLTELSCERVFRFVNEGVTKDIRFPFKHYPKLSTGEHQIYGLTDVLDNFANGVKMAITTYRQGQIPLFVFTGPSGCGKTELGKKLEDLLITDIQLNPKYTFSIKKGSSYHACPVHEDPINLLTSKLSLTPLSIRKEFYEFGKPELCPSCLKSYNNILSDKLMDTKFDTIEDYCDFLDEFVEVQLLPPPIATADLTKDDFNKHIEKIINTCNRGILHIEVNDSKFGEIPPENYQTLLRLGDGRFIKKDGTSLTPDILVMLYTNWNEEEMHKKMPFRDRAYHTAMRWNLSWKEEARMYEDFEMPYDHINKIALNGMARMMVASRFENMTRNKVSLVERWLDHYAMFEERNPALPDKAIRNVLTHILDPMILDGLKEGYSVRRALKELSNIKLKESGDNCLKPGDAIRWFRSARRKEKRGRDHFESAEKYIRNCCISDFVEAYVLIKNGGSKEKVDKIFSTYYDIFINSYLPNHDYVSYKGKKVEPQTVLMELEDKLGVSTSKSRDFRQGIQTFMDQSNPKRIPQYKDILALDQSLIVETLKETDYLPWMKIMKKEGMTQLEQDRIGKIERVFKDNMGYCEHCARDALTLVAQSYNISKNGKVRPERKKSGYYPDTMIV